ncbi:MAG: hypothetical protein A2X81_14470 [Desulfobacterales bacterium GWB2_56_26]|nr:MAG: hypothetical protein A2X81_14470 [Desulfobacterales bacterium GWB2_56_26]
MCVEGIGSPLKNVENVEPMEESTRIRIGGIKFSEELAHVTVVSPSREEASFDDLLQLLSSRHINLPFLCHSHKESHTKSSFCISRDDLGRVQEALHFASYNHGNVRIIPSVGTLTLFPHRNSFRLLGLVLMTFAENDYPIHSLSTSISAIALNTDFRHLDNIADKLAEVVILPENHAPFRQEFRLTQLF